jgi:hypothetical protein
MADRRRDLQVLVIDQAYQTIVSNIIVNCSLPTTQVFPGKASRALAAGEIFRLLAPVNTLSPMEKACKSPGQD